LLRRPNAIAADAEGRVFVVGANSDNAFRIDPSGEITQIVDHSGPGSGRGLNFPNGVAVGLAGDVYVIGNNSGNALHIDADGTIREVLKAHAPGGGLGAPSGVTVAPDGSVYVSRLGTRVLWRIALDGRVTSVLEEPYPEGTPKLEIVRDVLIGRGGAIYLLGFRSHNVVRLTATIPGS
jgi:DNA-binding beta-propeller fold protein YncE